MSGYLKIIFQTRLSLSLKYNEWKRKLVVFNSKRLKQNET